MNPLCKIGRHKWPKGFVWPDPDYKTATFDCQRCGFKCTVRTREDRGTLVYPDPTVARPEDIL